MQRTRMKMGFDLQAVELFAKSCGCAMYVGLP